MIPCLVDVVCETQSTKQEGSFSCEVYKPKIYYKTKLKTMLNLSISSVCYNVTL